MYYLLMRREDLLQYLPKGAVGAEIGVAHGDFSAAILQTAEPRELHLIDPWSHLETGSGPLEGADLLAEIQGLKERAGDFGGPPENRRGDEEFAAVTARFGGDARVRLHRQYSYKAVTRFDDAFFDFVYIDGNHLYEFVFRDLEDFAAKLKPDGLLFGHDFFEDAFARNEHYGIIGAVSTFLKRSDFRFVALTWEPFSTFCLARSLEGFAGEFLRNVVGSSFDVVELPDALADSYQDKPHRRPDGSVKRIPSFVNPGDFSLN